MALKELADNIAKHWGWIVAFCASVPLVIRYGIRAIVSVSRALHLSAHLHRHYGDRNVATKLIQDICDRHKQVATTRTRIELVESKIGICLYITDIHGKCTDANERLCELFGLEHAEFAGFGWTEALHPDDRIVAVDRWEASIKRQITYDADYRVCNRRTGQTIHVGTRAEPVICCTGEVLGYVGVVWEIDDAKP